jgi:hypothetical protein
MPLAVQLHAGHDMLAVVIDRQHCLPAMKHMAMQAPAGGHKPQTSMAEPLLQ